jgi:alkanesulfonate monooxygenase SsuD/methylene tetrahydromethanopterin reductase-like flavin-dependent oxidoreductase (luciferase family)
MILRGEKLVYDGEIFNLDRGFKLRFTPPRTEIPIYIAAMGPKNVVQSGEISDGVLPVYWPSNKWGEMREQLDEGARIAGRPPHSAMIAPYITTAILSENATEEERAAARFAVASPLAYYIGKMGVYYAQMLTRNGYGAEVEAVKEGWKQGMKGGVEAVTPELLDATSIIGTPREIVIKLDQWVAAGVDEPVLAMPSSTPDEAGQKLAALMEAVKA